MKHKIIYSGKTAIHTSITGSYSQFSDSEDLLESNGSFTEYRYIENITTLLSARSVLTHKFNKKLSNRTGLVLSRISYDIAIRAANNPGESVIVYGNEDGATEYMQGFSQFKWILNHNISFSAGIHSMLFLLNNSVTAEPRLGVIYKFLNGNSVSLAYGNHSQIEPLPVYFFRYESASGEIQAWQAHIFPR